MIVIKDNVDVRGLHPKLWEMVYLIKPFFDNKGVDLMITSALDSDKHMFGSLHYLGAALDIRSQHIDFADELFNTIAELLPSGYDCVNERTHYHIEWQPKTLEEKLELDKC
jgi:hypothetical protein